MAQVRVLKGPIDADLFLEEVSREDWHLLLGARRSFVQTKLPHDCRELIRFVEDGSKMYEVLGFTDLSDFVRRGLEIDPDVVDWAIRGLKTLKPGEPVTLADAVSVGKLHANGTNQHTRPAEGGPDSDKTLTYGTSRDYIIARLIRDGFADEAQAVHEGRKSANRAALDHGWRKPPACLIDRVCALLTRMTDDEVREFEAHFAMFLESRGLS